MKRWQLSHPLAGLLGCAVLALVPLAGCEIYFGGDDDDCSQPPIFDDGQGHRNPHNGACEPIGGGGGGCGDVRPDSGGGAFEAPTAFDWGDCPSACEQLGEAECLASPDCHATYIDCAPGGDCRGPWMFNQCWDLPPSGGNYGQQCEGLDAESCNRNADCVSNYHLGDSGEGYPSGGGPLSYDSCAPEGGNFGGCFSQADCPDGFVCTAETECLPPPGCEMGGPCPDVCFGRCIPSENTCAGVDCAPGYHCEETCTSCDPATGNCDPTDPNPRCQASCVPDQQTCPILCPPNSECQQVCTLCPEDPNNPMCGECHAECVPVGGGACANVVCPMGQHCEERCEVAPDGTIVCHAGCVVDQPPPACPPDACMPGTHCEVHCTTDAAGNVHCERACVPDVNGCANTTCPVGTTCVETCVPPDPACMGGPVGCPPVCTVACVPEQPATCEAQTNAADCESVPGCEPVFTATCTPNPDGTFTCTGFTFVACQHEGAPTPLPPMP
jgi:hypothetical protein